MAITRIRPIGKPIAGHLAIAFKLAETATKVEAAHAMMVRAARLKYEIERLMREAPFLLIGEGASEIQKAISRGLLKEYAAKR